MTAQRTATAESTSEFGNYLLPLIQCANADVASVGQKAANLAMLLAASFPVPDGYVLTTDAFEAFLASNSLSLDPSARTFETGIFPLGVANALKNAAAAIGDVALAVRSSGVAEDLPSASFAGQYETVLNVRGAKALLSAVRHCWASAFSDAVTTYRRAQGQSGVPRMAILVQRLMAASAAGVAFTANPVTGDRTETVVSAVRGLGERLVSGQASPDEWLVKGSSATCLRAPEGAITEAQAQAIAELARRVEAHFGTPQDVEWAIACDQLFLLQSRPITALPTPVLHPIPVPVEPPPGFWQREASHAPQPHSPMNRSLIFAPRNRATKHSFAEFGVLLETLEFREIGGWEYTRLVPLGGKDRPAPPAWLMPVLIRLVPQMRSRIRQCVEAMRSDKPGRFIRQWYEEWQPRLATRISELRTVELAALSNDELDAHLYQLTSFLEESFDIHFLLHAPLVVTLADLVFTSRDVLGWDEGRTFEMLNGLSEMSTEPSRRLAELAKVARQRPALQHRLQHIDDDTEQNLIDMDREFAAAFAAYQQEFGCRALRYEVADPTVAESPSLALGLIYAQIVRGYDPVADSSTLAEKRAAAVAEARALLAQRSPQEGQRFERALARAQESYPVREDNEFYTISVPIGLARYALLELGRRLSAKGSIADRDDVFFLEFEEAREALRRGGEWRPRVSQRREERIWVEAHPGPDSYGKNPGPPPSFASLPSEARFVSESVLWYVDRIMAQDHSAREQADEKELHGLAASPGRYVGPVRVVMNESEFGKIQPGDVLVCPITSPVWSILFPSIGALVTDTGGILSHPAIISREYRVPAVVATGNATQLLRDGQMVTVDGTSGRINIADKVIEREWENGGI
jgi:phosphohistidine swiveling domain-containing protein